MVITRRRVIEYELLEWRNHRSVPTHIFRILFNNIRKSIKFVVGPSQRFTAYMVDLNQCLFLPLHDIEDGTTAETFMNYYLGNIQKSVHLQK